MLERLGFRGQAEFQDTLEYREQERLGLLVRRAHQEQVDSVECQVRLVQYRQLRVWPRLRPRRVRKQLLTT